MEESSGHARVRRQQPKFSRAESQRRAMGTWRGRECRMDWCSFADLARSRQSEADRVGSDFGRRGSWKTGRSKKSCGRLELRAQHSVRKSERRLARVQNERRRSSAGTRFSATRDCSWLVRDGVDQMAPANYCHRQTVQRLLSNARLRILEKARGQRRARSAFRNANQSRDRAAERGRNCSGKFKRARSWRGVDEQRRNYESRN